MAGRPSKSLEQLVLDGTFAAKREHHRALLDETPNLRWKTLSRLQDAFRDADHEFDQRRIAREFQKAIPGLLAKRKRNVLSLREQMEKLGPAGSAEQVARFFPWAFRFHRGPKAGKRFHLGKHQRRFTDEFYGTLDRRGRRVYTRGLVGGPKGWGKTPFAGGLGHYHLCTVFDDVPLVFALAGSREQAGRDPEDLDRMHAIARKWASEDPLSGYLRAGAHIRCPENSGAYRILTSEGRLAAGVDPTFWLIEEFSLFRHQREIEAVNALLRSQKRGEGGVTGLAISNAGYDKSTPLGEMYDGFLENAEEVEVLEHGCLTIARDPKSGSLMHWYAIPDDGDIEDPKLLRAANPLTTVSVRDLLRDLHAPGTNELDWRRLNGNQWTAIRDAWLPIGTWPRLAEDGVEIPAGAGITVGVDAAYSWDTTAVVWAWRRPEDGRVVVKSHVWTLRPEAPADEVVAGPNLDNEALVEPFIHELNKTYRIRNIVVDPNKFLTEGQHLAKAGFTVVHLFPQGHRMREAENEFYKAALAGRLAHNGDPVLKAHVGATGGRRTSEGHWHISKLFGKARPIDATMAAVMANWGELTLEDEAAPFVIVR